MPEGFAGFPYAQQNTTTVMAIRKTPQELAAQAGAHLRQAIWEASQHMSAKQIEKLVPLVLQEIAADA